MKCEKCLEKMEVEGIEWEEPYVLLNYYCDLCQIYCLVTREVKEC